MESSFRESSKYQDDGSCAYGDVADNSDLLATKFPATAYRVVSSPQKAYVPDGVYQTTEQKTATIPNEDDESIKVGSCSPSHENVCWSDIKYSLASLKSNGKGMQPTDLCVDDFKIESTAEPSGSVSVCSDEESTHHSDSSDTSCDVIKTSHPAGATRYTPSSYMPSHTTVKTVNEGEMQVQKEINVPVSDTFENRSSSTASLTASMQNVATEYTYDYEHRSKDLTSCVKELLESTEGYSHTNKNSAPSELNSDTVHQFSADSDEHDLKQPSNIPQGGFLRTPIFAMDVEGLLASNHGSCSKRLCSDLIGETLEAGQCESDGNQSKQKKSKRRRVRKKNRDVDQESSPHPNAFVAIRIPSVEIREKLQEVQKGMITKDSRLKTTLVSLDKLHLTLMVFRLNDVDAEERAKLALVEATLQIRQQFNIITDPLIVKISGIGHFSNSVVFANVNDGPDKERLHAISELVRSVFESHGIYSTDKRPFQSHLTIAKMSSARRAIKDSLRSKIKPDTYADFKGCDFGVQVIVGLELLSMSKPAAEDGYYYCFERNSFSE